MKPEVHEAIKLLKKEGYQVKKLDEREQMIQHIMDTYDKLSKEGRKLVMDYVMMLSFCSKHKSQFERFKFKAIHCG